MKFYKNTDGNWILGNSTMPAGSCLKEVNEASGLVRIESVISGRMFAELLPTEFQKENGDNYASLAELEAAVNGFFEGSANIDLSSLSASEFHAFSVEITRPANTTVYSAGDVVADVTAAFVKLADVAKAIGAGIKIVRVRIQTEDTGVAGKKFNLHLYKDAPTFIADNAAFAINYANAAKRIGAVPVVMGTGNLATVGMNDYNQCIVNPTARDVYWVLETVDGFTPSANSTKFQITIDCELSN